MAQFRDITEQARQPVATCEQRRAIEYGITPPQELAQIQNYAEGYQPKVTVYDPEASPNTRTPVRLERAVPVDAPDPLAYDDPTAFNAAEPGPVARGINTGHQRQLDVARISAMLVDAQIAHHEEEERTGQVDENWATWYAVHLVKQGVTVR